MLILLQESVSRKSIRLIGSKHPICVLGQIKKKSLVGIHGVYPLVNFSNYPKRKFAYWLINPIGDGNYVVLNVLFL
jgi:hypothetical protein